MIAQLTSLWKELESGHRESGITARRFLPELPVDLFVGIENPGNLRLIFVEGSFEAFAQWQERWPQTAGVTVTLEEAPKTKTRRRLAVRLKTATYREVFTTLVADLLGSLQHSKDERAAVSTFIGRLDTWQRLLARQGVEALSVLEQRGLYGELWFLRQFVLPNIGPVSALQAWTGPLAKDQDFQFAALSVEVKASAALPDQTIHISNVRQLDDSGSQNGPLYLFHLALEERHAQGEPLMTIVESVRATLGAHAPQFNDLLLRAGYLDAHAHHYASAGYVVKGHGFFRVEGEFPRILEADLRPGVGDVRYVLSLGACAPFVVPEDVVLGAIRSCS